MTNKIKKAIPLFLILAVFGLVIGFKSPWLNISGVKADNTTSTVTSGNVSPVASATSLNSDGDITLTENTTTSIPVTGTVTDANGCQDLTSVKVAVYKEGTTCGASGDANNDNCYFWEDTSPSTDSSCTGPTDTAYAVNHSFAIQFYAEPGTWKATVTPADAGAGTPDTSSNVTLNGLQALNVSAAISYGSVNAGANSTGDHTAVVTDTGNAAIDVKISGTAMTCATRGSIPVGNQQYATSTFAYGDGTALSVTATDWNLTLPKPDQGTPSITDTGYWQVSVPVGTAGLCSGTNTFTAEAAL